MTDIGGKFTLHILRADQVSPPSGATEPALFPILQRVNDVALTCMGPPEAGTSCQ